MKDLIAKLQMDANCALGAIWMHIEAREKRIAELEAQQAFGIGETYANALSRIAELEAQIAAASALVVEQQPIGYTCQYDLDCLANYNNVTIFPEFDKDISPIALYTAPQAADTDKLRQAILAILPNPPASLDKHESASYCVDFRDGLKAAAELVGSTALQAPVREVPENWQLVPKEPTGVMKDAGAYALPVDYSSTSAAANAYRAMLAAVPVQEPKP